MGSGNGGGIESRLARVEAGVDHLCRDVQRIHSDIGRLDVRIDRLDEKFDRKFDRLTWFIIATLVASVAGLLKQFF